MTSIDDFELPKACIMRVIKAAVNNITFEHNKI